MNRRRGFCGRGEIFLSRDKKYCRVLTNVEESAPFKPIF